MGKRIEDACVGCGLPCTTRCEYYGKKSAILVCDHCGCEPDELYKVDGEEVCEDCLKEMFERIEYGD